MKKIVLSLFLVVALASLPCASFAEEELTLTKPGRMLTTSLLGITFGSLVGAMVAAFTTSSTATPILIGAGAGLVLGFTIAALTPTSAVEEVSPPSSGNASLPSPKNQHPGELQAAAIR